jgi:hypothetical protein
LNSRAGQGSLLRLTSLKDCWIVWLIVCLACHDCLTHFLMVYLHVLLSQFIVCLDFTMFFSACMARSSARLYRSWFDYLMVAAGCVAEHIANSNNKNNTRNLKQTPLWATSCRKQLGNWLHTH